MVKVQEKQGDKQCAEQSSFCRADLTLVKTAEHRSVCKTVQTVVKKIPFIPNRRFIGKTPNKRASDEQKISSLIPNTW